MKGREKGQGRKRVQERVMVTMMVEGEMAGTIFFAVGRLSKNQQQWADLNPCCCFFEGWEIVAAAWAEAEEASFYWGDCCCRLLAQPKSSKLAGFGGWDCCLGVGGHWGWRFEGLCLKAAGHRELQGWLAGGCAQD